MTSTDVVRQQVQEAALAGGGDEPTVFDLINRQRDAVALALPKHLDPDRIARIALTTIRTTPKLAECTAPSLLGALMVSAQLGLEPGGPLGHAFFVPRWNSRTRKNEAQFQLGYRGIIELARRSGRLTSIEAHEVCENDEFSYSYGLNDDLTHRPLLKGDRGEPYAYYALAKFKDGGHAFVVLGLHEIRRRMDRTSNKKDGKVFGPWVTDFDAMARKTCIRALAPYLPLSPELEAQIASDGRTFTPRPETSEGRTALVPVADDDVPQLESGTSEGDDPEDSRGAGSEPSTSGSGADAEGDPASASAPRGNYPSVVEGGFPRSLVGTTDRNRSRPKAGHASPEQ